MTPTSLPSVNGNRILDDLLEELAAAVQAGETVDVEAYAARFPDQADQPGMLDRRLGHGVDGRRSRTPGQEAGGHATGGGLIDLTAKLAKPARKTARRRPKPEEETNV